MTPQQIDRIAELLFSEPLSFIKELVLAHLTAGRHERDSASPKLRLMLDDIEKKMSESLSGRALVFWLYNYRRLKTPPTATKQGQPDWWSTALTQGHAELAILKYSNYDTLYDFSYQTDLDEKELELLFNLEGLSRQYRLIIAKMRALGKAGTIDVSKDGDLNILLSENDKLLLDSFDKRVLEMPAESTLVGTAFEKISYDAGQLNEAFDRMIFLAARNTIGNPLGTVFSDVVLSAESGEVPKFIPRSLDLRSFLDSHDYMTAPFEKKFGVRLDVTVSVLWAIGRIALGQTAMSNDLYFEPMLRLSTLGIFDFRGDIDSFVSMIGSQAQIFLGDNGVSEGDIRRVVDRFKFDQLKQDMVALWSGGPRAVIFETRDRLLIDLSALGDRIHTLFVGLSHDGNERGDGFEAQFESRLKKVFGKVFSGEKKTSTGVKFELDAALLIDDTLLIFECVSSARALDFELGKPDSIQWRIKLLEPKTSQVLEVAEIIKANPIGRNYDFSHAKQIIPIVVSPFVEWIWSFEQHLWINEETPRILSAEEAIQFALDTKNRVDFAE